MINYDIAALLSPLDFETLSKDLLEAEFKVSFENFREGSDNGIDLRHASIKGKNTIVQCKRYKRGAYRNLLTALKKEIPKLKNLNPSRYIVTTTCALSPDQVNEIRSLMNPYIKSTLDIFGLDRLNSLISKHPEVERRHIKLWSGSAGVLETILHAGVHSVSREEIQNSIRAAKLYVKNESFDTALSILGKERVCIISGLPGIGKTTLARILLLYFYKKGFEIIKIESDISEARPMHYRNKRRLYLYDDFLGQTGSADKLNKNEDQKLLDFMKSINESKTSLMILTTREYILNQAKLSYEKLDRENFDHRTCILDLTKYSRRIKAQILYNHMYHSNLPKLFIQHVIHTKGYLQIIDHPNYNPRLIEFLTTKSWIGTTKPEEYMNFFISKLNDPTAIWDHAFRMQLSSQSRHLLVTLVSMPTEVKSNDLKVAFTSFHNIQCNIFGISRSPDDFHLALKELDGTFTSSRRVGSTLLISYRNPSIRDYIKSIAFNGTYQSVIESFVFFEQAQWLVNTLEAINQKSNSGERYFDMTLLVNTMKSLIETPSTYVSTSYHENLEEYVYFTQFSRVHRLVEICKAISYCTSVSTDDVNFLSKQLTIINSDLISGSEDLGSITMYFPIFSTFKFLDGLIETHLINGLKRAALDSTDIYDFSVASDVFSKFSMFFSEEEIATLRARYQQFCEDFTDDYIKGNFGIDDPEEMRADAARVSDAGRVLNIRVDKYHESLLALAAKKEKEIGDQEWESEDSGTTRVTNNHSDREIESMFNTLK